MLGVSSRPVHEDRGFLHEALLYGNDDAFVAGAASFIAAGLSDHEPTLVVVSPRKIDLLRTALSEGAATAPLDGTVRFENMEELGHNPARILPAWKEFIDTHGDAQRLRGIGEPIWAGRDEAQLVECRLHEALLNVAFTGGPALHLMCPYDVTGLESETIDGARHTHPFVTNGEPRQPSAAYQGAAEALDIFTTALPPPAVRPDELRFATGPLHRFRTFVGERARCAGLDAAQAEDVVLAANEIASNSLLHGGGTGVVRTWSEGGSFLCEIRDRGHIDDLMVGRVRPARDDTGGRGVWMANQLCDLVQVRSSANGTVVRLRVRVG